MCAPRVVQGLMCHSAICTARYSSAAKTEPLAHASSAPYTIIGARPACAATRLVCTPLVLGTPSQEARAVLRVLPRGHILTAAPPLSHI
jgi:hypothetical protein